ncbi:MAG: SDR family oxidoreductase [Betaproteobacteria bacterium AqS2]|uniref:SDR family oxidoreductase n=1 Tax=Candidatus Amphirhobacter heronislandensis TaxID=1732024 RepID=A0A930UIM4_9GAMM|nr:SDR family oxidoreductase [Betaproteobacteria bacterium AqS2]
MAQQELAGRTAVVTGAVQGIGRAIADAFAAAGAQVAAADVNAAAFPPASELPEGLRFVQLDVTDDAQVAEVVKAAAPDILVNVAGVVHHGAALECSDADWEQAMRLNVRSAFKMCQAALPAMVERRDGCVINISSVASSLLGVPARCAYSVSKAALLGLTRSVAADYIKANVRANAICPGTVRTPSWEQRVRDLAAAEGISEEEALARFVARQPLGRVGLPGEVAALAVYLASPAGSFATGQEFSIDGGWSGVK